MATSLTFSFSLLTIFLLSFSTLTQSTSLHSFVYGGCSQLKFNPDDTAYAANLNSLLTSLVNSATYSSYNHFTVMGAAPHEVVYGVYQCRGDLSMPDCASCVANSVSRLGGGLCPGSCGGALQLQGCFVKYDNDTFIGKPDNTVIYKKCGGASDDGNVVGSRDAVLDGVMGGSGPYRVGGSREAQGMAQCVGDLSGGECQDCVAEAVKQVKMQCGNGKYGDMYLGKCYVRYTIGGGFSSSHGNGNGQDYSDKNRGVKTFALVIGLLAAIAILIIFLTFICRAFGGSGK